MRENTPAGYGFKGNRQTPYLKTMRQAAADAGK
jgi:hypothetical protein